jgi:hypothetical protein
VRFVESFEVGGFERDALCAETCKQTVSRSAKDNEGLACDILLLTMVLRYQFLSYSRIPDSPANLARDKLAVSRIRSLVVIDILEVPQPFRKAGLGIQGFPELDSFFFGYIERLALIAGMDKRVMASATLLEDLVVMFADRVVLLLGDRAVAERNRPLGGSLEHCQRGNVCSGDRLHDLDS